jgi:ribose-phosphate pyrophosphokinase
MIYINLVNENDPRGLSYKISRFPDGQQTIDIDTNSISIIPKLDTNVKIISRLSSFRDLELIIGANQAIKELVRSLINIKIETSLYVPYFLGARSDRKFIEGSVNYLKSVICPIINSQNFSSVEVLDPHSDVLEACLNNFKKTSNFKLIKNSLTTIDNKDGAQERIVLISPDGGALKKIFDVAEEFVIPNIVTAMKHRDIKTGKITHTEVPDLSKYNDEHKFVIIDDICDGGRTFIELAKVIKEQKPNNSIYLIVSHGIFSAGFDELNKHFDKIFTTNSYKDHTNYNLEIIDLFQNF